MKKDKKHTRSHKATLAHKRRQAKRARKEADRKLIRKLYHICEQVNVGNWEGVKTSTLLACNMQRARRYLTKKGLHQGLLDIMNYGV